MLLYLNGDSHTAGAEICNDYAFAEDDPLYTELGRSPHPDNLKLSYGAKLAEKLECDYVCQAESASSNMRILRTAVNFVSKVKKPENLFVVIGWSSWERQEWTTESGDVYQISAGGNDDLPDELKSRYKKWIAEESMNPAFASEWLDQLYAFHVILLAKNVKHLFFNTFRSFDTAETKFNNYVYPFDQNFTMYSYLTKAGYKSTPGYHFKEDGHNAWAEFLFDFATENIL